MEKTTRRGFLSTTSLSTFGIIAGAASINAMTPEAAEAADAAPAAPAKLNSGAPGELEDFIYDIANGSKGWLGPGGSAKEATVEEFPVSQSIAGVIMKLNPGGFRELHWPSIAAAGPFVLGAEVRT